MRRREPGATAVPPHSGLPLGAYLELIKPRITTAVVLTTATGLWLAPQQRSLQTVVFTVLGTVHVVRYTAALVAVSLMFVPLRVAGGMYLAVAASSGALFLAHGLKGLRPHSCERWARAEFVGSLAYLVVLLCVLVLDHAGST